MSLKCKSGEYERFSKLKKCGSCNCLIQKFFSKYGIMRANKIVLPCAMLQSLSQFHSYSNLFRFTAKWQMAPVLKHSPMKCIGLSPTTFPHLIQLFLPLATWSTGWQGWSSSLAAWAGRTAVATRVTTAAC